jgi:adenine-specific DNA-methyltransferase
MEVSKVKSKTADLLEENVEKLSKIFPEVISEGKIDFERLKKILGDFSHTSDEFYGFSWVGKDDAFKNRVNPTRGTFVPDEKESVNFNSTENLFIEGDNLESLKLLHEHYSGKIKMIYIDPPYNTGKEFIYSDNFKDNIQYYLEFSGQIKDGKKQADELETSGRVHSKWLSMMYSRLGLAWELLKEEDGVIFISIDDREVHNLRFLMNDIFGEENFLADIIWNSTKSVTNTALISVSHTHNLVYAKNIDFFTKNRNEFRLPETEEGFSNPDNDKRGPWKADPFQVGGLRPNQLYEITNPKTGQVYKPKPGGSWKNELKVFKDLMKENRIVFGTSGEAGPQRKRFLSEALERGRVTKTLWTEEPTTTNATMALRELLGGNYFNNPKPVQLIQRFIQLGAPHENDIVLDFFAGSGTTGHAVWQQNQEDHKKRKFILTQLPEAVDKETEAYKSGMKLISEITVLRLKKAIDQVKSQSKEEQDYGFKIFRLTQSNFRIWNEDIEEDKDKLKAQLEKFSSPLIDDYQIENVIFECIIKEKFSLHSDIEKIDSGEIYKITDKEKSFVITFDDKINESKIHELITDKDEIVICKDSSLDETQKANFAMKCNLKTI